MGNSRLIRPAVICLAATLFGANPLCADVKMSELFGDHMVLQQDVKLPVWGWADPGEAVTVTVGTSTARTTTGSDGKWRVDLAPLPADGAPQTLTVAGRNTLTFSDVLVGDVWICSGQSNMEYGLGKDADKEVDNPNIRIFWVNKNAALTPQDHFGEGAPERPLYGHWQVCTRQTISQDGSWNGFSAVGYYFGHDVYQSTRRPVGMIGAYWGGTPAQAWTSLDALAQNPALAHYADGFKKLTPAQLGLFPANWVTYDVAARKWDAANQDVMKSWQDDVQKAKAAGQPAPLAPPVMATRPRNPGNIGTPATLFNGMIHPLIPYAIKGVIWYQGESNVGTNTSPEYGTLLPALIGNWRQKWGQGDFPFLIVQLPNYQPAAADPAIGNWPILRESQARALALPNTGLAITLDVGASNGLHPADKRDVGARLALVARHVAYGQDIVYTGPGYDSMKVEGGKVRVSFKNTGSGLIIGSSPIARDPTPPTRLTGFELAGADRKWIAADAVIDGQTVVVSSDQVTAPVAVRYAWADNPTCNLYNKAGLPAAPFRSDPGF